ncbi:MAG: lamin tail domain-containing protein, partial [Acidimicrobiales bacterium]
MTTITPAEAGLKSWTGKVIRVIDGDTFDVRLNSGAVQTIRLAGINTNETKREPKCWADQATKRLKKLIGGKTVKLRARNANSKAQGRPFRHVFVGKINVAKKLLKEGYGVPFVLTQETDFIDDYVAAFYKAFDARRRIHNPNACGAGPAANIEMLVSGNADGPDVENLNGEYVQIRNNGTSTLSLAGWSMHDSATDYYTFPASASIPPGGVLRVHAGSGNDSAGHLYMGFKKPIYSNIDGAFLLDPDGDMRAFQNWPCDGICRGGALPRLVIDEVQYDGPGNDSENPNVEWVRIRNVGTGAVDLRDWSFVTKPYVIYSATSRVLRHGETLTLYIGEGTNTPTTMYWGKTKSILNNEGDSIALVSPAGDVAACRAWGDDTCAETRARGFERASSDFDGDGYDDLAVGVPGEDFGTRKNAGSVVVIPGRANGIARSRGKVWSQRGKIAGTPATSDRFGEALAVGDFDGDGYDDLAVGVPGEDVGGNNDAGSVNVIYGSASGLATTRNAALTQTDGKSSGAERGDEFGSALTSGDFDGDGYDDLAVGV